MVIRWIAQLYHVVGGSLGTMGKGIQEDFRSGWHVRRSAWRWRWGRGFHRLLHFVQAFHNENYEAPSLTFGLFLHWIFQIIPNWMSFCSLMWCYIIEIRLTSVVLAFSTLDTPRRLKTCSASTNHSCTTKRCVFHLLVKLTTHLPDTQFDHTCSDMFQCLLIWVEIAGNWSEVWRRRCDDSWRNVSPAVA